MSWLLISDRFAPERFVARRAQAPLLVIHSQDDPVVPYDQGRRLYDAASEPKEFWRLDGSGHTEAFFQRGPQYRPALLYWLDKALPKTE